MQHAEAKIYEQIVEGLSSGVVAVDASGRITVANAAACLHLDLPHDALLPGNQFDRVPGVAALLDAMGEVRASGASVRRHEVTVDTAEGPRTLGMNVTAIEDGSGNQGFVFLFTDLTEVKRLARAAEVNRQLAQIGELTAGVVHELRNPLSVVSGMAELLVRHLEPDPALRGRAEAILSEAAQMGRLITEFLGFARPYELKLRSCTASQIMLRTQVLCVELAKERCVHLDLATPADDLPFEADPDALTQVLGNILRNAIEISEPGKRVMFRVDHERPWVQFQIADEGPGINLAPGEDLFRPFFSKREGGTGLGLSIAQRGASAHGGEIRYSNRKEGGAVFLVRIPQSAQHPSGSVATP